MFWLTSYCTLDNEPQNENRKNWNTLKCKMWHYYTFHYIGRQVFSTLWVESAYIYVCVGSHSSRSFLSEALSLWANQTWIGSWRFLPPLQKRRSLLERRGNKFKNLSKSGCSQRSSFAYICNSLCLLGNKLNYKTLLVLNIHRLDFYIHLFYFLCHNSRWVSIWPICCQNMF